MSQAITWTTRGTAAQAVESGWVVDDGDLVARARSGDPVAFERLYEQYHAPILNYLHRMVSDRALAEDLTQDTFEKAYKALPATRPDLAFKSWLYRIATNTAISNGRRKRIIKWIPFAPGHDPASDEEIETSVTRKHDVEKILAKLPPHYSAALLLAPLSRALPDRNRRSARDYRNRLQITTVPRAKGVCRCLWRSVGWRSGSTARHGATEMTDGVRRLNHEEAEMLISARMDEQLDRTDSRALLVHLQTCESCRAFAVQSEVLGRELAALPVLPPSALVDRQIRETIGKGRSRWSLGALMPAAAGNGGLRIAVGALAMLTLVSVFLLIRMADDQNGEGPAIEAPNGGVAQQLDRTPTEVPVQLGEISGPTETARVVVPKTPESGSTEAAPPTQAGGAPTDVAAAQAGETTEAQVEPTRTLDSSFVYTIDKTKTPESGNQEPTSTEQAKAPDSTEESGDVSVAAALVDDGTPVDTADATAASDSESPIATESAATPTQGDAAEPTETPMAPTQVPTEEATQTAEPPTEEPATEAPATTIPEPTATATPVEISVDATEAPPEATTPPPADASSETIEVESEDSAASPDALNATPTDISSAPNPTETPQPPAPLETPAGPFGQPTIAPISGETGGEQGTGETQVENGEDSPPIVSNGGADVDDASSSGSDDNGQGVGAGGAQTGDESAAAAGPDDDNGSSPPIVPSDGTNVPDGVGGNGQGGDNQQPPAVPTVDESIEPSGLDLSDTVTSLPPGTTGPVGRLEFSPGMNLYVVIAPDGQLAVADLEGELVVTIEGADLPVWSGSGLMFSTPGESGARVSIWNSDTGDLASIPPSENEASDDVPIGGDGSAFYYLRIYPDSGIVELRSASIDGSDNGVLWTSDAVTLGAARPLYSDSGVFLPTDSEWLFIDWDGNESSLGENPYGYVGAPVLSPGGGLMAYSAGDEVIVAWTDAPGVAISSAPFGGQGGYAFATSGEEIVVSDGSSLARDLL